MCIKLTESNKEHFLTFWNEDTRPNTKTVTESVSSDGNRRFDPTKAGESKHYIIDVHGNLEIRDKRGIFQLALTGACEWSGR